MKTKPTAPKPNPATLTLPEMLAAEADRFRQHGLELAASHLFKPNAATERLAREHFVRAETYRAAAKLASA